MITVVNIIIRELCIFLIKKIGYHLESEEVTDVMRIIFIATFFNTAILLLLTNANTSYTILRWIPLRGYYTDLNENWYLDMSPALVMTMMINSVYMYFDFAMYWAIGAFFKILDQGCSTYCCCKKNKTTKCLTPQQYVNLY
jgi:hypothetical protein